MKTLSFAALVAYLAAAKTTTPQRIDLGHGVLSWRTAIYVDGPPNDLYINYANELKLQSEAPLGQYDQLVWWSSQYYDKTNYLHTRYTYDVPSGQIYISYHVTQTMPGS